jgi:hypothetical protein
MIKLPDAQKFDIECDGNVARHSHAISYRAQVTSDARLIPTRFLSTHLEVNLFVYLSTLKRLANARHGLLRKGHAMDSLDTKV